MTEYAPAAIKHMFDTIKAGIPGAVLSGIVGDSAHTYGYHRGRNYCSDSGDYSCQTPPDQKGDGEAACAIDLTWASASDQHKVSQRLLDAKNDSRMNAARSFFGSTDGYTVCGWDYYYGNACTSDDTHLWHIHLSILRQYANDEAALQNIAQVITGSTTEDDMPLTDADATTVWNHNIPLWNNSTPDAYYVLSSIHHYLQTERLRDATWNAPIDLWNGSKPTVEGVLSNLHQTVHSLADQVAALTDQFAALTGTSVAGANTPEPGAD